MLKEFFYFYSVAISTPRLMQNLFLDGCAYISTILEYLFQRFCNTYSYVISVVN